MENKYYAPGIDEFHVGFEYEIFEDWESDEEKSWHKQVYGPDGTDPERIGFVFAGGMSLGYLKLRVKCLDREDIESLGWKFIEAHKQFPRDYFEPNPLWKNTYSDEDLDKLEMFTDYTRNIICIKFKGISGKELFRGFCKNKSELKKLMAQLGIA